MLSAPADSLRLKSYKLDEVVVTGTRNETDIRHLPMTISVVGRQQLEQTYQPSILPTLTEQVPGLFTTSRGIMGYGVSTGAAGGMSLRGIGAGVNAAGGPTTSLLVLIDGHPQYMGLMGHPIADAYQSMMAERVEVLRGPASVLYGSNAMGGVINIVTRKMQEDGVKTNAQIGYGSYNTLQTEVSNRVRKGRFSSVVTGSYNRTDGHRDDMEFEQYGGYAKLGYDFSDTWKLWGDVNITRFNASNPGEADNPYIDNDSRITRGMTSFALENRYDRTSGAVSFFYNWGRHRINDGYHPGGEPQKSHFNSKDRMLGISWYQSATLFTGNRLTVGFDYQHFGGESWNKVVAIDEAKPGQQIGDRIPGVDKQMDEFAGYVDFKQDINSWLSLDAGVRIDHHSHVGTEWIPQGGLAFHLPWQAELKAMVSKGFRNPTIREMYMFPPQNPDLKAESLMNYELAAFGRGHVLWGEPLLHQRGQHHHDRPCPAQERQLRRDRELGCGNQPRIPHQPPLADKRQLQLAAHGESGTGCSRAQTLCRCGLYARTLESVYRYTIREGASYLSHPEQGEAGKLRTLEPACQLPSVQFCRRLCQGRKPAGATL